MLPLVRRSQPGKVRPIVLGPVLIALASRHVLPSDSIKQRVQQMSKLQLGVGVPNGIEQVIHTVQLGMMMMMITYTASVGLAIIIKKQLYKLYVLADKPFTED